MTENEISRQIVELAIEVHPTLGGPGLLESDYEKALVWELQQRGLSEQRQLGHAELLSSRSKPRRFGYAAWGDSMDLSPVLPRIAKPRPIPSNGRHDDTREPT